MSAKVKLIVTAGKLQGREFVFGDRTTCTVGRAGDCYLRLPDDYLTVSRHHCVFEIDPPEVRVRDIGSRNGTFVNGVKIGQRGERQDPEGAARMRWPERRLHEGDEVRVGDTALRVDVLVPAASPACLAGVSEPGDHGGL